MKGVHCTGARYQASAYLFGAAVGDHADEHLVAEVGVEVDGQVVALKRQRHQGPVVSGR